MRRALLAIALLAAPAFAHAQAAGQWQGPEHIWRASCAYCHETGLGPKLLGARLPAAVTIAAVRRGPSGMPPFTGSSISDQELKTLAAWLNKQPAPPPPPGAKP